MEKRKEIIDDLIKSYWMEIETVINYISNSINLDGVRRNKKIIGSGCYRRNRTCSVTSKTH